MSADEAFDNLMQRNAFSIPVADDGQTGLPAAETPVPQAPRQGTNRAVRVDSLFNEPADYIPRGGATSESERGVYYNHPTETDLDPVGDVQPGDDADLEQALDRGARVIGRDVDDEYDAEAGDTGEEQGLGTARRLRRFAYLPLAGSERFEADARDTMAAIAAARPDRPSLALTSASRGDGRTELAIRLALALAKRVGQRVLLVDFDVRNPRVARRLGISAKYFTLADVLRGACPLADALTSSDEDNLYVLPARNSDREGDEIVDSRQTGALVDAVHRNFDFAVFDCGPTRHPEVPMLCRLVGATVLAGYCGVTGAAAMREAGAALSASGAHVAGMMLTGA